MVSPSSFLGLNLLNELTGNDRMLFEPFFLSDLGTALVVLGPLARRL